MKKSILPVILLFVAQYVFSQQVAGDFEVVTKRNVTIFKSPDMSSYAGNHPKDSRGKELNGDPDGKYSDAKLKMLENGLYDADERAFLRKNYGITATLVVNASNGSVVSVSFVFSDLSHSDSIDTQKLSKLSAGIKKDIRYENLVFGGQKAISGYMLQMIPLFRNR